MYVFPSCFWNAISLTVIGKDRLRRARPSLFLHSRREEEEGQARQTSHLHVHTLALWFKANWREALFCTMCTSSILLVLYTSRHVVLDEADQMLERGFADSVEEILSASFKESKFKTFIYFLVYSYICMYTYMYIQSSHGLLTLTTISIRFPIRWKWSLKLKARDRV